MISPAFAMLSNCCSSVRLRWDLLATLRLRVPSGLVSVIPQPWIISTPSSSKYQRISDTGGALPPQVSRDSLLRSCFLGFSSNRLLIPCQIVGTPADIVTSSCAINATSLSASINRCGRTCLQPSIDAVKGSPQPMA